MSNVSVRTATTGDIPALVRLAEQGQDNAANDVSCLPGFPIGSLEAEFQPLVESGAGVVAERDGEIKGYILVRGPFDDFHGGGQGVWSPLGCTFAPTDSVFTSLLTGLGNLEALRGTRMIAITAWASDVTIANSLVQNGFGVRTADAIAPIKHLTDLPVTSGLSFEFASHPPLAYYQALADHLAASPVHMGRVTFSQEQLAERGHRMQSRTMIAVLDGNPVAHIEWCPEGENLLTHAETMANICGAWVEPQMRGTGIMRSLVGELARMLAGDGISLLGVDYETINPEARRTWQRWFVPYSWGWVRHIDSPWGGP